MSKINKEFERVEFEKFLNEEENRFESNMMYYKLYDVVYNNRIYNNGIDKRKYIIIGRYYTLNGCYRNYSYRLKEVGKDRRISSIYIRNKLYY